MKKFLTLLALMIATVTAYATDYTGNATSTISGNAATHTGKTVTVTETDAGYTFVVKEVAITYGIVGDFTIVGVKGTTNADGSITYSFTGSATTTNVKLSAQATEGGTKDVTMSGKSWNGQLYMTMSYKGAMNMAATYTFGEDFTVPEPEPEPTETPVTYTANAVEKVLSNKYDLTSQVVDITKTADNTYKVVYKDLYFGTNELGDFTAEGVTGIEDADGNINYSFTGTATISNTAPMAAIYGAAEGATVPFSMEGSSKDNVLKAQFNTTIGSTYSIVILYNGYTETTSPTITAGEVPTSSATNVVDEGTSTGGNSFSKDKISINWDTQKLVASIDVSSETNQWNFAFVVGANLTSTGPGFRIQLNGSQMNIYSTGMSYDGATKNVYVYGKSFSDNTITVEISKDKGLYINGDNCNKNGSVDIDFTNYFSEFWKLTEIIVGNTYGGMSPGNVKYNYIRILDKDSESDSGASEEKTAVTLAESTSGEDLTTTLSGYNGTCMYSLTLARTLVAGAWNTFCVPFNVPQSGLSGLGDVVIKKYKNVTGTTMYLEDATEIVAGQPYLIKPAVNIKNPTFQYATISSTEPATAGTGDYQFVGVYGTKTFSDAESASSYILVSGGKLVNPTAGTTMKGMRAYFTYTGKAGVAPRLVIDGVETALSEVIGSEAIGDGRIYNLRGMYVGNDESKLAKGIYIKNGKKVVLK